MKKEENKIKEESELEEKKREKKFSREERERFRCTHCHAWVSLIAIGTKHRNHCPVCLWSKHVDVKLGDRGSVCDGSMVPIGFTFKKEGIDRYTKKLKRGELMVIHQCVKCGKIFINRLAGDDSSRAVVRIFKESLNMPESLRKELEQQDIDVLTGKDEGELMKQLGL